MSSEYRDFLELSYSELEEMNLAAKEQRKQRVPAEVIQEERLNYLREEKRIKAVTVAFSDLEGRLHTLDYDKKFLVKSYDNLTFDGSSIRGFTAQRESDLRLAIDWAAFYWVPADVFGSGKVLVFGEVIDKNGGHYAGDLRGVLKSFANEMYANDGWTLNAANEIEGFLFESIDAERNFNETGSFEYVNQGGYYHSLPGDPLRNFIDTTAEVQRAMGFENEKDHPEVAPSQFEINYTYGDVVTAADQIQLYKLICRQVATQMGMTASFLPKPVTGVNGSGMHTNVSITKNGQNLFWDLNGPENISMMGWQFVDRILTHGNDLCLLLNASVNAYRRLDPHFEAPNQIKASATDRGSMVRIPIGNEKSSRVEVRSVGPDANPYIVLYSIFRSGLQGDISKIKNLRQAERYLPDNIYTALADFKSAEWTTTLLGEDVKQRYAELKQASADRCPRLLGTIVKRCEIQFHHDVYNQLLWGAVLGSQNGTVALTGTSADHPLGQAMKRQSGTAVHKVDLIADAWLACETVTTTDDAHDLEAEVTDDSMDRTESIVRTMLRAIEAPLYDVGVLSDRGMLPGLDGIPASAVLERLSLLKYRNARGSHIYIRPSGEHRFTVLDDLDEASLARLSADGFSSCTVVEDQRRKLPGVA